MGKVYLNGRITLTSTAVPSAEDMEKVRQLSDEDRAALAAEILQEGRNSPISDDTMEDVWERAMARAKALKEKAVNAL